MIPPRMKQEFCAAEAIESDKDDDSHPGHFCCTFKLQVWSQMLHHSPASSLGSALPGLPPSMWFISGVPHETFESGRAEII